MIGFDYIAVPIYLKIMCAIAICDSSVTVTFAIGLLGTGHDRNRGLPELLDVEFFLFTKLQIRFTMHASNMVSIFIQKYHSLFVTFDCNVD